MATPNFNWTEVSASQNQKEVTINDVFNKIEDALSESFTAAITGTNTFTLTNAQFREAFFISCTDGGISDAATVNVPAIERGAFAIVNSSGFAVTVQISGQPLTAPIVDDGEMKILVCTGTNVRESTAGVAAFLALTDTPSSYAGQALKAVRVNAGETALEFGDAAIGGSSVTVAVTPTFRGALVSKTADQLNVGASAFPGTALTWETEQYDTDSIHDNVTNNTRLTVPSGVTRVRLRANVFWEALGSGVVDRNIAIYKNGADFEGSGQDQTQWDGASINRQRQDAETAVIDVVGGDYFEVFAWQSTTANDDVIDDNETWFSMEIIETSDSQQLPTAFLAVEPTQHGALVSRTGSLALATGVNVIPYTTTEYDTEFQPNDTGESQRFWLGPDIDFVDGDVNTGNDTIAETAHGFTTGEGPVQLTTSGVLPTGLAAATNYWVIRVDADTLAFAASRNLALADSRVNITAAAGGGTHTIDSAGYFVIPAGVTKVRLAANSRTADLGTDSGILAIQKNGATVAGLPRMDHASTAGTDHWNVSSAVVEVAEGDRFSVEMFMDAAETLQDDAIHNWFSIDVVQTSKPLSFPGVTVERPHIGVSLRHSTTQGSLAAATNNALTWDTELYDTGYRGVQFHDTGVNPTRITIPAGVTKVKFEGAASVSGVTGDRSVEITKNGSTLTPRILCRDETDTLAMIQTIASGVLEVVEGDYFELNEFHGAGTGTTVSGVNWFIMTVVETEEAAQPPLDLSFFVGGSPTSGQKIGKHVATRRFSLNDDMLGSELHADTATTGSSVFDVQRNGVSIGSITVAASGTTGTFTTTGGSQEDFEIGDYLTVVAPNPADATLADIAITLFGFRS